MSCVRIPMIPRKTFLIFGSWIDIIKQFFNEGDKKGELNKGL